MRSDEADTETSQALADFVRDELEGPVADLAGRTAALVASETGNETGRYRDDLERARTAAANLQSITAARLAGPGEPPPEWDGSVRTLRHDLRTPITAILGYGELVAEEAADNGDQWLVEALEDTLAVAAKLLHTIDRMSDLARHEEQPERQKTNTNAAAEMVRRVMSASEPAATPTEAKAPAGIAGRILVTDDNPAMRDLISRRLQRQGHAVETCSSGEDALERIAAEGFDLLMLDLLMPGIDGLEVLKRLKGGGASTPLPVIVMSALDEVEAAVRCIEAGADDYLAKPLDETLLRARIGSSLERKFLRDRELRNVELLRSEQARSDALLRNILPVGVVKRLAAGETVIADSFEEVTVLFCDLVGFTALSAELDAVRTLRLLEEVFSRFDALADANGLEKIKTIGDAYMVVGGLPEPIPDSALRVVRMAREMPAIARSSSHGPLDIRIGIHTGPAAAGIIGTKKFFYDVWGDTVNIASRLETSCEPGRIHVSEATAEAVGNAFTFERRAPLDLQGKGRMQTFYLEEG